MLLIIEIDDARVEIHDSKLYPEENYKSLLDLLKWYFNDYRTKSVSFVYFLRYQVTNTSFFVGQGLD